MIQATESKVKTPTFEEIISAPADQWRQLAAIADADIAFCERVRVRRAEQATVTPKRTRRPGQRRSRRNQTASGVYSRQVAQAMIEALSRVNGGNSDV